MKKIQFTIYKSKGTMDSKTNDTMDDRVAKIQGFGIEFYGCA